MQKYKDKEQSFFYVFEKSVQLHQSVFSAEILNKWESWYESQKLMFSDPDYFIENIVIFQWAMHIGSVLKKVYSLKSLPQNFQKHQLENKSLNLKVITYESESYGAFTKTTHTQHKRKNHLDFSWPQHNQVVAAAGTACIYRWSHTQSL